MARLFYRAALADDYPAIPLMVFQVVVILAVAKSNITLFGKKQLLDSVLIDHIAAIVSRCGCTAYLMDCSQPVSYTHLYFGSSQSMLHLAHPVSIVVAVSVYFLSCSLSGSGK